MTLGDLIIRIVVQGDKAIAEIVGFKEAVKKQSQETEKNNERTKRSFEGIAGAAQKAFYIFSSAKMLLQPLGDMVREAAAAELAMKKVEQAVSSTGGTAGFTAPQLAGFARELQGISTFGDDQILNEVTAQILTFTNIAGDQFKRTQQAAMDVATVLDGDLQSASIMLGKALNDPVSNLGALSRAGIQFSDEQEKVIKTMAKTGDIAGAQTIILDELNRQYGGQAAAAAQTGAGAIKQFNNVLDDIKESGGKVIQGFLTPFLASTKPMLDFLAGLSTDGAKAVTILIATTAVLIKLPAILGGIGTAAKALGISIKIAAGPVSWIIAAIIAAIGLLAAAWVGNLGGIQEKTRAAFNFIGAAFSAIWEFLKNFAANVGKLFGGIGDIVVGAFTFNLDRIKSGLSAVKDSLTTGITETLNATKLKFEQQLTDVKKARDDTQAHLDANPVVITVKTAAAGEGGGSARPKTTTKMEVAGPRGVPAGGKEQNERDKDIVGELGKRALEEQKELLAQQESAERESYARRQQAFDEFAQVSFSGYDTFWQTLYQKDMTGKQRADQVWQSMRGAFTNFFAQKVKAYLLSEVQITTIQNTQGAARSAVQQKNFIAENIGAVKNIGKNLALMASRIFAELAKLGPFGFIAGLGAAIGAVALVKNLIGGLTRMTGMAVGGMITKPEIILAGEAGPEIVAPKQDFIEVVRSLVQQGVFAVQQPAFASAGGASAGIISRLDKLEMAISKMQFTFAVDGRELAAAVDKGQEFRSRNFI